MQKRDSLRWWAPFGQWRWLIGLCLVAGLIFRCVTLDHVYWYDEAFTSLRISGYTEAEVVQALTAQPLVAPAAFEKYRQINPNRELSDTVSGLAEEEPQHTPLYYVLVRVWASLFGDSVATIRSFSIALSILALPCMAWLCWELYRSTWTSWLGMALLAVSPFQIIYAQEARPTVLWVVMTLVSSATLLRALRVKTTTSWLLYAFTMTLNLYTFLFSGIVAIAHAVYALGVQRRWTVSLERFVIALLISLIAFGPWLFVLATKTSQVDTVTSWVTVENQFSLFELIKLWSYHSRIPFVDRGELTLPPGLWHLFMLFQVVVRLSVIYALYILWRRTSFRTWFFVFTLIAIPALALTLPDLVLGGLRSTIPRYQVPVYVGFGLAMTFLLAQYLVPVEAKKIRWPDRFGQAVAVLVLLAGILSSILIVQSPTWWHKVHNSSLPRLAEIVNQSEQPLVVSDAEVGDLLAFSYYLEPNVRLLVRPQCYACQNSDRDLVNTPYLPPIPDGFSDVYLFNPRPLAPWLEQLDQQTTYEIETLSEGFNNWLWRIQTDSVR